MKMSMDIRTALTQTLTPQQIQYLKLLQMSNVEFEQFLEQEIDQNPLLENPENPDSTLSELISDLDDTDNDDISKNEIVDNDFNYSVKDEVNYDDTNTNYDEDYTIEREEDPFEFQSQLLIDNSYDDNGNYSDDEEFTPFQIKDNVTFIEELENQLSFYNLSEEEKLIGNYIIGNIDEDGYLRLDFEDILNNVNSQIAQHNFNIQQEEYLKRNNSKNITNPAYQYAITEESKKRLEYANLLKESQSITEIISQKNNLNQNKNLNGLLRQVTLEDVEKVHNLIKKLDPPGIGSRNIQECLIAQLEAKEELDYYERKALAILKDSFEAFIKKHFDILQSKHYLTKDELKNVLDVIKQLNPKPGKGNSISELNTVIPDFIVERDSESNELLIYLNDSKFPVLKVSDVYDKLKKTGKLKSFNNETKEWLRQKKEDAKFIVQAIQQRKITLLKVMTAIAHLQKDFFYEGSSALKPLIYKTVADETNLDISTVCRIVNNKYVLTDFGTFELKYFFSESLPNMDGEDISTTVIKEELKNIINNEPKDKPYSDDYLAKLLKEKGYNVARRTVAKYRDQLKIPVARLRKEL